MESLRATSPWLLHLMLLTSLVLSGVVSRPSGEPAVCGMSCCSVLPSCVAGRTVVCNCPENETVLGHGDIPTTVLSVTIRNSAHVIIEENAIEYLTTLVNFTLSDIGHLEITRGGMTSQNGTGLRSVKFENITSMSIESHSFVGVWQPQTTIKMSRIHELRVKSKAFDYQTGVAGPSASLQHVHMLDLQSNGFSAPLFQLALTNVTMDECHEDSFGANAYVTEWTRVTIRDMQAKCFHGPDDQSTFNINSVIVNTTRRGAFSGSVHDLNIEDSYFGIIEEKGFDISVTSIEFSKSTIDDLQSHALNVLAKESFWLNVMRINNLRKDAFLGLRPLQLKDELAPLLNIRKLELINSENGSLTFSKCAKVQLIELDLVAPWPRICPTEKWTRAMSGGGPEGRLTQSQSQLFSQLLRRRLCPEDGWTRFPLTAESPNCEESDSEADRNAGDTTAVLSEDALTAETSQEDFSKDDLGDDASKRDPKEASRWDETKFARGDKGSQEGDVGDIYDSDADIYDSEVYEAASGSSCRGSACSASRAGSTGQFVVGDVTHYVAQSSMTQGLGPDEETLGAKDANEPVVEIVIDMNGADVQFLASDAKFVASLPLDENARHAGEEAPAPSVEGFLSTDRRSMGGKNTDLHLAPDTIPSLESTAKSPSPRENVARENLLGLHASSSPHKRPLTSPSGNMDFLSSVAAQLRSQPHAVLYVMLGAVLMLIVVLASFLMALMLRRYAERGHTDDAEVGVVIEAASKGRVKGKISYSLLGTPQSGLDKGKTNGSFGWDEPYSIVHSPPGKNGST